MLSEIVLQISHLNSFYGKGKRRHQILKDVSLELHEGEVLGIVGESGSGKSTLAKCILGMVTDTEGQLILRAQRPQMVFQDPYGSLNPAKTVGWILEEPLRVIGVRDKAQRRARVLEMLKLVGLSPEHYDRRPAQLSGGQRQRRWRSVKGRGGGHFIILDEPVSALDVTLQAQILRLLAYLKEHLGLSYLFISHDLAVVYQLCDRVAVLYQGRVVEQGTVDEVYDNPRHDYTKKLLAASTALD